jgi:hypothetical protein
MAFWSVQGPEPKRQYRWVVTFASQNLQSGIQYALKKVDKPKAKVGSIQHKYLNHFFNYPGRLEWEDVNMTFAAITQPDATYLLNDVLIKAGYGVPQDHGTSGNNQLATIGKLKFNGALGNKLYIKQLNPEGTIIEEWELNNPFFTSVQFGSLDYSSEEIVEIQTTVKYDWAKLNSPTSESGASVNEGITGNSPGFP